MAILPAILAALALQTAPGQAAVPDPAVADEIVVTAERIRKVRASITTDRKTRAPVCRMKRSSGDAEFDDYWCATMLACHHTAERSAPIALARASRIRGKEFEHIWLAEARACLKQSIPQMTFEDAG